MKTKKKHEHIFDDLLESVKQARSMERGKLKGGRTTVGVLFRPAPKWSKTAIKKLREQFGMSQPFFASMLNVKTATVRSWEQGQRVPDGAAARLLEIFSEHEEIAKDLAS